MAKKLPIDIFFTGSQEQGESREQFLQRVRTGNRAGLGVMTGGVFHGIDDPQTVFEEYGVENVLSQAKTQPGGTSGVSGGNMPFRQLLTFNRPEAPGAFLTDFAGAGATGSPQGQFGTTTSGQRVDQTHPEVQALMAQGLNPDVAIGNVVMNLNRQASPIPPVAPGIVPGEPPAPGAVGGIEPPAPAPLSAAQQFLQSQLSPDVVTSGDFNALIEEEQKATEKAREALLSPFERQRKATEELGRQQLGLGRVLTSRAGGGETILPAGSVEFTFLANIERQTLSDIKDLESKEIEFFNNYDLANAKRMTDLKIANIERLDKLKAQKLNLALQLSGMEQEQAQFGITSALSAAKIALDLPAGQTIDIPGYGEVTGLRQEEIEPFFKGSDILGAMKSLPVGQTTTITDPNTGDEWNITGIGKPDQNTKTISSTNNSTGEVTLTTYNEITGEIISQSSAGKIGGRLTGGAKTITEILNNDLKEAGDDLRKIIDQNGFTNTQMYIDYRDAFNRNHPGKAAMFDEQMRQLGISLNPNDPTAKTVLELITTTKKLQKATNEDNPFG